MALLYFFLYLLPKDLKKNECFSLRALRKHCINYTLFKMYYNPFSLTPAYDSYKIFLNFPAFTEKKSF